MTRYAKKVDSNHNPIKDVFETLLAGRVTDCSGAGFGFPDLFVSYGHYCCGIEIKRSDKAPYTAAQIRFQNKHPHAVIRVENIEQAQGAVALIRLRARALA